jgi:quercetin dioxygenase-like cupin family protein
MTLEKLPLAGSVAALAVGVFVFASPHYAQTMTPFDTDAAVVAAAPATHQAAEDRSIRPFTVHVPQAELDDLRRRIAAARRSDRETVTDRSQGVQLETLQALVRYWGTDYDWRKAEAKPNALPQFMTTIDDADIHFIHARSRHLIALPLIMTHGWPGSVFELLKTIGPLTDPPAYGGRAEDRRHHAPGGHHGISGRGLSSPGDVGPARLSQPDLLPRGRPGRTLRRMGAARTLCSRTPCRLQITSAGTLITRFRFEGRKEVRMKTTRIVAIAALIATTGLALHVGQAQQVGARRIDLQRHDLSVPGREVVQTIVELAPGTMAPRHTHPGEEIIYVLEGTWEYTVEGKPPVTLKAGDVLFIPAGTIHSARNIGTGNAAELATYILEKGKPLLTVVE